MVDVLERHRLNRRVDIEIMASARTDGPDPPQPKLDSYGQPEGGWVPWRRSVPAQVETLSGRQLELAQKTVASATIRITLDYLAGLAAATHRIICGDSTIHIEHVEDVDLAGVVHVVLGRVTR